MSKTLLTPRSPLGQRLIGYLNQRFPPVVYTLLVVVFYGSAVVVSRGAAGLEGLPAGRVWLGAPVVWGVFLHLRIFDEHKDFHRDVVNHPDRLLSRGVVTLALLRKVAAVTIALELVLSLAISSMAVAAWAAAFFFTLLMRVEFGIGGWLSPRIVLYALTHNPITALLAVFAWAATGVEFTAIYAEYLLMASFGALAFEWGRKTRNPNEEQAGVDTYSSVHGRGPAGVMVAVSMVAATVFAARVTAGLGAFGVAAGVALGVPLSLGLWATLGGAKAGAVEGASSLVLLATLMVCGVAAW